MDYCLDNKRRITESFNDVDFKKCLAEEGAVGLLAGATVSSLAAGTLAGSLKRICSKPEDMQLSASMRKGKLKMKKSLCHVICQFLILP